MVRWSITAVVPARLGSLDWGRYMSGNLDRREFLKGSLVGSAAALAGLSFEEQALLGAAKDGARTVRETEGQEPPMGSSPAVVSCS